jgi:hypothetical protein
VTAALPDAFESELFAVLAAAVAPAAFGFGAMLTAEVSSSK